MAGGIGAILKLVQNKVYNHLFFKPPNSGYLNLVMESKGARKGRILGGEGRG